MLLTRHAFREEIDSAVPDGTL